MVYKVNNGKVEYSDFLSALNSGHFIFSKTDTEQSLVFSQELFDKPFKQRREVYMDAYRKYQAAVNYGEVERDTGIDEYIQQLKDKDWTALDNPPPVLLYFCGSRVAEAMGE